MKLLAAGPLRRGGKVGRTRRGAMQLPVTASLQPVIVNHPRGGLARLLCELK
jgi:hypothetical protein